MTRRFLFALPVLMILSAVTASAEAPTPAQRCEADIELSLAKFASCRLTAESRFSRGLDEAQRGAALSSCSKRFQRAVGRATSRYGLNCSTEAVGALDAYLAQCSNDVVAASVLNGSLPRCGDGRINAVGEQCDADDLGEESCERLGLLGGGLRCDLDCRLDAAGCLVMPTPTLSPTPTPSPTTHPTAPIIMPNTASPRIGESVLFAVVNGIPPYTVNASGGTAVPTTLIRAGGTFTYTKTQAGTFVVVVVDSAGVVGTATVSDPPSVATTTP